MKGDWTGVLLGREKRHQQPSLCKQNDNLLPAEELDTSSQQPSDQPLSAP